MFFVRNLQIFTACLSLFILAGCVSPAKPSEFNQNDAVNARINLALAYLAEKDFAKAKENIDRALVHNNRDYLPHAVLAYYYQQLNQQENAESSYQTALKLSSNRPDLLNNYGTFLCGQHKFEAAFSHFERAMELQPSYEYQVQTLENIVLCSKQAGQKLRFFENLSKLAQLEPEKAEKLESFAIFE